MRALLFNNSIIGHIVHTMKAIAILYLLSPLLTQIWLKQQCPLLLTFLFYSIAV
jgi:hypothetical protein